MSKILKIYSFIGDLPNVLNGSKKTFRTNDVDSIIRYPRNKDCKTIVVHAGRCYLFTAILDKINLYPNHNYSRSLHGAGRNDVNRIIVEFNISEILETNEQNIRSVLND